MRTLITWLPAFIAFFMLFFYSTSYVFLNVYLPVLLLLPQSFQAVTTGFPKLSFCETTIIPLFFFFLFKEGTRWKFSLADLLIVGFISCRFISIYLNADLHSAINRLALMLCDNFAPYCLAKGIIYSKNLNAAFAKRFVFLLFINVLISFFEAVTSINPHVDIISFLFFPGNPSIPLSRYGMTRIVGPFGQAIFYGIGITIALLLNYWLIKNRYWKPNFSRLPVLFFTKGTTIAIVLVIGLLLNLSRGPWLACFVGLMLMGIGFSKQPMSTFFIRGSLVTATLALIYIFYSYLIQFANEFSSETEANVVYRFKLIDLYLDVAWEKPWFGWDVLPTKRQSLSIDNQYLYLFLSNGILALFFFTGAIVWCMIRLFFRGLKTRNTHALDSNLSFTIMSVLMAIALCFFTVYMGDQIENILFLLLGWGEGLLISKPNPHFRSPSPTLLKKEL